jgi:GT2 family glycosyltransferase
MKLLSKTKRYLERASQILSKGGLKSFLQAVRRKLHLYIHRLSRPLSVQDCLKYYQNLGEIQQTPILDKDILDFPKVSILVLTYNNFHINELCLRSIYSNTTYPNFEVVVVDNASQDETPAWLTSYAKTHPNLRVLLNTDNRGFAGGNNQAAHEATGEFLIFLNNDTIVTWGWIERLLAHIKNDPMVGLVGPVTNSTGNEACIPVNYSSPAEMETFASDRASIMAGQAFDIRMLAFYCVMARKDQYEALGGLDERFKIGMFEDDDLAVRYHQQGWRVICADDVFIHHFQRASFGKLGPEEYQKIFDENRKKYEEKWGRAWEPYVFR